MDKNNESYTKGTILIVIILFMFSSKLFNIVWDIGKSLLYIFLIIYCLNILNPNIAKKIKEILNDIINTGNDNNIIKKVLSMISSFLLNLFNKDKSDDEYELYNKKKIKTKKKNNEVDNSKVSNLRNLDNRPNNIGRKLA